MARRRREGGITSQSEREARVVLSALAAEWSEVQPTGPVRHVPIRLKFLKDPIASLGSPEEAGRLNAGGSGLKAMRAACACCPSVSLMLNASEC